MWFRSYRRFLRFTRDDVYLLAVTLYAATGDPVTEVELLVIGSALANRPLLPEALSGWEPNLGEGGVPPEGTGCWSDEGRMQFLHDQLRLSNPKWGQCNRAAWRLLSGNYQDMTEGSTR